MFAYSVRGRVFVAQVNGTCSLGRGEVGGETVSGSEEGEVWRWRVREMRRRMQSHLMFRCDIVGLVRDELLRKHLPSNFEFDQERKRVMTIRYLRCSNHKLYRPDIVGR